MKERIQVAIAPALVAEAKRLMVERKFDNFSGFLEALIRDEWERRNVIATLKDEPPANKTDYSTHPAGAVALNDAISSSRRSEIAAEGLAVAKAAVSYRRRKAKK